MLTIGNDKRVMNELYLFTVYFKLSISIRIVSIMYRKGFCTFSFVYLIPCLYILSLYLSLYPEIIYFKFGNIVIYVYRM